MSTDGKGVLDAEIVVEGIWPELDREVSTMEHGTKSISNGEVSAFDGTVLVRRVRACCMDAVAELTEELLDLRIPIKFPSLIHIHVLVGAMWRIISEELPKP